jgi:hypothetical protein
MIPLRLLTVLFISLATYGVCAQGRTYKELLGTWDKAESRRGTFAFQFVDSVHVTITSSKGILSTVTYLLDTTSEKIRMTIEYDSDGLKMSDAYFIKLLSPTSLRMEYANSVDTVVKTRPFRTYLYLRKRKTLPQKTL